MYCNICIYIYIHISVVEMKQIYTTMSKFIAFSNSFCPPMPLGKTFPTEKKSQVSETAPLDVPHWQRKKGDCLHFMQRWGPGISPPFFGPRKIYWGGFRVACSQESLHKKCPVGWYRFVRIGRCSRKYVSQVSKIWSLPTYHYTETSQNIWSPGDVGPCGLKNCKKITSHIWGPPNCFLEVIFLGNSNHHLVPCSKPLKVFSNSYPSLANPRSSIMWLFLDRFKRELSDYKFISTPKKCLQASWGLLLVGLWCFEPRCFWVVGMGGLALGRVWQGGDPKIPLQKGCCQN